MARYHRLPAETPIGAAVGPSAGTRGIEGSKDQMNADMVAAGLKVVKSFDLLPEQYFVVAEAAVR
jgi:hypothetical protein